MIVIGCDPGLTGAISLLHASRGLLEVEDLPVCGNGLKEGKMLRWLDAFGLDQLLKRWSDRHEFAKESIAAVIERPFMTQIEARQTTASTFDTFGAIRSAMLCRRINPAFVPPAEWKRFYGLKKIGKGNQADAAVKAEACRVAKSLYQDAPITLVKHHNRAESILIGHWHLRKIHG